MGLPVAVDAMGSDHGPGEVCKGVLEAVSQGANVVVFGDQEVLSACVDAGVTVHHTPSWVDMDQPASMGMSPGEGEVTSVMAAARAVAEGRCGAFVSFGNTGAAVLSTVRVMGMREDVERVALGVEYPAPTGHLLVLDVGATVDPKPQHLVGFAQIGLQWAQSKGIEAPHVALLSNGEERSKGNRLVRETLELAQEIGLEMQPAEPKDVFSGDVHVLVTDGFTGNVFLKTIEVAPRLFAGPGDGGEALMNRYGAARLFGINGLAFIGHGRSGHEAVATAILRAYQESTRV